MALFDNILGGLRSPSPAPSTSVLGGLASPSYTPSTAGGLGPSAPSTANGPNNWPDFVRSFLENPRGNIPNFVKGLLGNQFGGNVVNAFGASMTPAQENFLASHHAAQAQANGLSQPYDIWRSQVGIPTFMGVHSQIPTELHPTIYTPGQLQLIGAVNNAIA